MNTLRSVFHSCFRKSLLTEKILSFCPQRCYSSSTSDESVKKIRFIKRMVWTTLFGSTLIVAIIVKKRRSSELLDMFTECKLLPKDKNFKTDSSFFEYRGVTFVKDMLVNMKAVEQFEARPEDIYVISFPKAGSTWLQEIVYLIMHNMDIQKASSQVIESRVPYLEYPFPGIKVVSKMASPRLIKTHLPYTLLPDDVKRQNCKIVYLARNPRDLVVSYYHFVQNLTATDYGGSFEDFVAAFVAEKLPYCPFWKHNLDFWERRESENILFLKYEDLKKDTHSTIHKIGQFLGRTLTDEQVSQIAEHCSFDNMRRNPSVNYSHWVDLGLWKKDNGQFFRKGQVGDWKNYFSSELESKVQTWTKENLKGTELTFTYT